MSSSGYESWFLSARDPVADRALWIRHTRHHPRHGPESAALWCTVVDHDLDQPAAVVKEVFADFPAGTEAGPGRFRGRAAMAGQSARWDLVITGAQAPLRPLRPAALYRAPLPRTKLEAVVPDGSLDGTLEVGGREIAVSGWRGPSRRHLDYPPRRLRVRHRPARAGDRATAAARGLRMRGAA